MTPGTVRARRVLWYSSSEETVRNELGGEVVKNLRFVNSAHTTVNTRRHLQNYAFIFNRLVDTAEQTPVGAPQPYQPSMEGRNLAVL